MDWFRVYHGMPTDPKWILVARLAGAGVTPGHVVAVWSVLLDHASQAKTRGCVVSADLESIAASLGWDESVVSSIYDALVKRHHIVDGCVRTWVERNPEKYDRTATERKKRQRAKQKEAAPPAAAGMVEIVNGHDVSRRDMRDGHGSRSVTPTEKREQSNCYLFDASADSIGTKPNQTTLRNVRERAGVIVNVGDFWTWLAGEGIPAHIGIRTIHRGKLAEWIGRGLTTADLAEALKRARQKRQQQGSGAIVNIGFLACFVEDVLNGAQAKTTNGGGYERGDQLSREFAHVD